MIKKFLENVDVDYIKIFTFQKKRVGVKRNCKNMIVVLISLSITGGHINRIHATAQYSLLEHYYSLPFEGCHSSLLIFA